MAHKTFISYKYSEARDVRDRIVNSLGEDARYYKGETSESPDLTDTTTDNIKRVLKQMMHDTTVTIVIISPNMKQSQWIDWEIKYVLKEITREDRKSFSNGIVGVIMKHRGGYEWFKESNKKDDGCTVLSYKENLVCDSIKNNRFNRKDMEFSCKTCQSFNGKRDSYISYVEEEEFLRNPNKYIEDAYEKSKKIELYDICKE